jgi:hypothetical protein
VAARRRGYALLIVMMLGFVTVTVMAIMLSRSGEAARSAQMLIDGYRLHHMQAGLRQVSEVWASLAKREPSRDVPGSVIGFDVVLEDEATLELRFKDVQGALRFEATDGSDEANAALTRAAEIIRTTGRAGAATLRRRGPGRVSLHSAPAEVLVAVVQGIDPRGGAAGFADRVVQLRSGKRLDQNDYELLIADAGLSTKDAEILRECVTIDTSLWFVTTTVRTPRDGVIDRQGGLVLGLIRSAIAQTDAGLPAGATAPTAAATAASVTANMNRAAGQNVSWTVLTWTKLPLRSDQGDSLTDELRSDWSIPGL